jgi:hypothetical protein
VIEATRRLFYRWRRPVGEDFNGGVEVVEILEANDKELEFIVAPRHIGRRGDTLNSAHISLSV